MRLKKVKGAGEKIEKSPYLIKNPSEYCGDYKKIFNNSNPIRIEVGMGKGNFIINSALNNKDINFIGIEKYDSVLVRAIEKLEDKDIPNLKLICMDAKEIDEIFKNEIDLVYLNFSDPWPKKRHADRRLTSSVFLKKYDNIFKNDKKIILKTDNRKFFEYSVTSFSNYGYKIMDISLNLHEDNDPLNVQTEYEEKFSSKGMPIYKVEVVQER